MPDDKSLEIRRAIVAHLRADATVTAIVPAARIFGEFRPVTASSDWPFIRIGYSSALPFEAQCWSGSQNTLTIHVFANGPTTDSVETISKRVIQSVQNMDPASLDGWICQWTNKIVVPDEVAEKLHGVLNFRVVAFDVV